MKHKNPRIEIMRAMLQIELLLSYLGLFQECKRPYNSLKATIERLFEEE
jgi:hypothetical protein